MQLQSTQVKAARAILGWSQEDLACRSGVGITTIRQFENGYEPRRNTAMSLQDTLEQAGLEFMENEGVRRRADLVRILEGADSCQKLYNDFLQSVHSGVDEIVACIFSYPILSETLGLSDKDGRNRIESLRNYARIKSIVPDDVLPAGRGETLVEVKYSYNELMGNAQYYVYGGKTALVFPQGGRDYRFVIFDIPSGAQQFREHFQDLWSGKTLRDFMLRLQPTYL
ncbi:MAG: multiprotein-bridging factor 1 family protein [Bdellovibrionales bacterium]